MRLPVSYNLTCIDKFMYMQACCKFNHYMHTCLARNCSEALSHCGHGHDLTSIAQLSVVNIADLRSAFVETLAPEHFRRNTVNGMP